MIKIQFILAPHSELMHDMSKGRFINYFAFCLQNVQCFAASGSAKKLVKCFPLVKRKHVAATFCLQNVRLLGLFQTD